MSTLTTKEDAIIQATTLKSLNVRHKKLIISIELLINCFSNLMRRLIGAVVNDAANGLGGLGFDSRAGCQRLAATATTFCRSSVAEALRRENECRHSFTCIGVMLRT